MAKKLFYKIGEACKILDIQPYVLRYWETEFPFLNPSKSKSGQRVYSERELDIIRRIKELLYEKRYTIAGAKQKLEAELEAGNGELPEPSASSEQGNGSDDQQAQQAVEKLRAGIRGAQQQAKEILALLGSATS